ncbi:AAA family ATPase [Halorubrum gandharaense]
MSNRNAAAAADSDAEASAEPAVDAGELVVVCGLPGVGKTTVAERIATHLDGRVLRTDVIRKELFPDPEYTDEETAAVYAELLSRARDRIEDGENIILDATFAEREFRENVRAMADEAADDFELVKVECEEAVVERRIAARDGISDADFDIHLHFKELFDEIDADHHVVDNSGGEAATFAQVDAEF